MTWVFSPFMPILIPTMGFCALIMLIVGSWYFATGRRKELAMTSEERERCSVTDPELSSVRALYTAGMIEPRRSDKPSNGKSGGDNDSSSDCGGSSDGGGCD